VLESETTCKISQSQLVIYCQKKKKLASMYFLILFSILFVSLLFSSSSSNQLISVFDFTVKRIENDIVFY